MADSTVSATQLDRETLERNLGNAQQKVYSAQAIVSLARATADNMEGAEDLYYALDVASDLLDKLAGYIDVVPFLAAAEAQEGARPGRQPTQDELERRDCTERRIRAYLAAVRPLRDVPDVGECEGYQRGRSLIERLAMSASGTDTPTMRFTQAECADVMCFLRDSEPVKPATWWDDPDDGPSHLVGLLFVQNALEESLRT